MSIKGSLKDYELTDIIAILAHRKESGRLQISFGSTEGSIYFDEGRLVAAHVGNVSGVSAVNLAISMEGSSFSFDPLVEIPSAGFNEHNERRIVNELLRVEAGDPETHQYPIQGCPSGQQIAFTAPLLRQFPQPLPLLNQEYKSSYDDNGSKLDSVPLGKSLTVFNKKQIVTVGVVSILSIGILAAVGFAAHWTTADRVTSDPSRERTNPAPIETKGTARSASGQNTALRPNSHANAKLLPKIEPNKQAGLAVKSQTTPVAASEVAGGENNEIGFSQVSPEIVKDKSTSSSFQEIGVVVTIEKGRVTEAYIKSRRPGAQAYETTALQLARQRRFPESQNGRETVVFRVAAER